MSLESILDTESVAVDQNQITLRIKPGVYQKRPDVIMAERDAARLERFLKAISIGYFRHKQNRRDKRQLQRQQAPQRGAPRGHPPPQPLPPRDDQARD